MEQLTNQNQEKPKNFWQRLKTWQKIGFIILGLFLIYIIISSFLCLRSGSDFTKDSEYITCENDHDCVSEKCGCLNKKGSRNFNLWTTFCVRNLKCMIPSSCNCQNGRCISNYNYNNEKFYKKTDEEKIKILFGTFLLAEKNCDINLANAVLTEKSKEIMHYTCSNMSAEYKCYKDITDNDYGIYVKNDKAILHFNSFSHKEGWPFFFEKENGEWKIDFHKMAFGISMGGSGCATGWGWRSEEIMKEFCSYFKKGECPEKQ
ncbi:MAG: hypothetical protein KAI71_01125 [Candidatus Pacebacteria bacterium]|nr:hypothetical protein [Candidatus Paceibacterota bacterium]